VNKPSIKKIEQKNSAKMSRESERVEPSPIKFIKLPFNPLKCMSLL
jgi:hypothetical protein